MFRPRMIICGPLWMLSLLGRGIVYIFALKRCTPSTWPTACARVLYRTGVVGANEAELLEFCALGGDHAPGQPESWRWSHSQVAGNVAK